MIKKVFKHSAVPAVSSSSDPSDKSHLSDSSDRSPAAPAAPAPAVILTPDSCLLTSGCSPVPTILTPDSCLLTSGCSASLVSNPSDAITLSPVALLLSGSISVPAQPDTSPFDLAPLVYWFPEQDIPPDFAPRFKRFKAIRRSPGPGQGPGILASPFAGTLEYDEERQDWKRSGGAWIGVMKNHTPQKFLKSSALAGYPTILGDGNVWHIPAANPRCGNCALPYVDEIDDSGRWMKNVVSDYAMLSDLALSLHDDIAGKGALDWNEDKLRLSACLAIGANYDLSPVEIARLGLLTNDSYRLIFEALIDMPAIRRAAMNTEAQHG